MKLEASAGYPESMKERAREMRRKGYRCDEIAAAVGICRSTVTKWTRGLAPQILEHRSIAEVREGWIAGRSATEIARDLKTTRNAVLGIVHRARERGELWAHTRAPARSVVRMRPKRKRPPAPPRAPVAAPAIVTPLAPHKVHPRTRIAAMSSQALPSLNLSLADLGPRQCQAVTDDTRWAQRYCGHPKREGSVYCEGHHALHHVGGQARDKAANL